MSFHWLHLPAAWKKTNTYFFEVINGEFHMFSVVVLQSLFSCFLCIRLFVCVCIGLSYNRWEGKWRTKGVTDGHRSIWTLTWWQTNRSAFQEHHHMFSTNGQKCPAVVRIRNLPVRVLKISDWKNTDRTDDKADNIFRTTFQEFK